MSVVKIEGQDLRKIDNLFEGWNETLIRSCLQGYMGYAWADSYRNPKSAQIVIADFCFFTGIPNIELVKNKPKEYPSDFIIMVPQNRDWAKLISEVYGKNATLTSRYAIKKEKDIFDKEKLQSIVDNLCEDYKIKMIDKETYDLCMKSDWSKDLCSHFKDYHDYNERGLGVVAVYKGEIVSGASSYTIYKDGIEIEIDTRADYRRKGLALACGAKLILEALRMNKYPSWDAQNKGSVALAEKLGYHFDKEYKVYEVIGY